jgi:hypothetical protein
MEEWENGEVLESDALCGRLRRFAGSGEEPELVPWAPLLPEIERRRLRGDLSLVLSEPELTGEPLDRRELLDILREYAALAGWDGPLLEHADETPPGARYEVDLHPQDERVLAAASPAVQRAARDLLAGFLTLHPTAGELLPRGRLKKMGDREIWQIELPDGYRLRYFLDEPNRTVYVVYLGPHPDGDADGRERSVRGRVQRRRHGEK